MSADRLQHELRELDVAWPPTPDLAGAVAERLAATPEGRPTRAWGMRRRWQAALAALLAAVAATMAIEPARSAVLDWLGLGSVRIERREPTAPPPGRLGARLSLGEPVTLAQARRQAGFAIRVPAALGPPDAVFVDRTTRGGPIVSFTYRPRPGLPRAGETGVGLLVTQVLGRAEPVIVKTAGAGTTVERLTVDGNPAIYLAGASHGFGFLGRDGSFAVQEERLAGDVLVVDRADGVVLRLEGRIDRQSAVRIAASAR